MADLLTNFYEQTQKLARPYQMPTMRIIVAS